MLILTWWYMFTLTWWYMLILTWWYMFMSRLVALLDELASIGRPPCKEAPLIRIDEESVLCA
jgi:hypothetical protein